MEKIKMPIIGKKAKLDKRTVMAFALILLLSTPLLATNLPSVNAQTKTKTYAFLSVIPTTAAFGQSVLINSWTTPQPPMIPGTSQGESREGYYYDFVKPDGSTFTKGPNTSDGVGSDWFEYTPDQTGTWKVKFRWAGDNLFEGVESPETTFIVQDTPAPTWPEAPLPEEYWTRPISAANREWYSIGGAWIQSTGRDSPCFNPYSKGPESSHILWKITTGMGGLIGGEFESTAYRSSAPSKIIMHGCAYFAATDGVHCVDVHTGKELWVPAKQMGSGSIFAIPGPVPYIWRISNDRFERFDAFTGQSTKNVTGMPSGSELESLLGSSRWRMNRQWMDSNGILYINVDDALERFIGTLAYDTKVSSTNFYAGVMWHLQRESMNSTKVYLNSYPYANATAVVVEEYEMPLQDLANMAFDTEAGIIFHSSNGGQYTAAIDAETGELLWNIKRDVYFEGQGVAMGGVGSCGATDTMRVYGFDLKTGAQLWESEPADYPWGGFRAYSSGGAYNKFYHLSYDGNIRAYDVNDGTTTWTFSSGTDLTGQTPFGTWPFYNNPAIADEKVYATTAEHSPTLPLKRGDKLYALDANTGTLLWSIMGCNSQLAISDGVLVASDSYMPVMYGFDKGQTAATVTISSKTVTKGSNVLIEGTIIDLSPAQPNTPAVSDESMSAWMEYLHMQQPKPTDTIGVEVKLTATDQDGNSYDIGTTTSDKLGNYAITGIPPNTGLYTINATFEGTKSYYSSEAGTAIFVSETSPTIPNSVAPPPSSDASTTYIVVGALVVVLAVISVMLLFRKHK